MLKPTGLSFVEAAALPLSAAAASQAVDPHPGQVVLINGASGGVGSYAIQLLAARGASVVATGTGADVERLTALGAAVVIDRTAGPVAEQVLAAYPDGVDALVNLFGNTNADVPLADPPRGGRRGSRHHPRGPGQGQDRRHLQNVAALDATQPLRPWTPADGPMPTIFLGHGARRRSRTPSG